MKVIGDRRILITENDSNTGIYHDRLLAPLTTHLVRMSDNETRNGIAKWGDFPCFLLISIAACSLPESGAEVTMKIKSFRNTIGGAVLGISLLLGIGFMSASTAQAQYRNDDYYRRQRDYQREQLRRQREWERQQRRSARRADRWDNDRWGNYGGSFDLRQTALNAGYNEGIKEGRNDRNDGNRFEYRDESDYRSATKDYNSRFGNRALYQQYFRQGFANGYRDGYRGY